MDGLRWRCKTCRNAYAATLRDKRADVQQDADGVWTRLGVVYTMSYGDLVYVGSCFNLTMRKRLHKRSMENILPVNRKIWTGASIQPYKKLQESGVTSFDQLQFAVIDGTARRYVVAERTSLSSTELRKEEEVWRGRLANLNTIRANITVAQLKIAQRNSAHVCFRRALEEKTFQCEHCNRLFPVSSSLKRHLNKKYPCTFRTEGVRKVREKERRRATLLRQRYIDAKTFQCGRCDWSFGGAQELSRHMNRKVPCSPSVEGG